MKFKQLLAKLYAVFLIVIALLSLKYIGLDLFYHEGFWGSREDMLTMALIESAIYIFLLTSSLYLSYRLLTNNYPKFVALWIAAPYIFVLAIIFWIGSFLFNP